MKQKTKSAAPKILALRKSNTPRSPARTRGNTARWRSVFLRTLAKTPSVTFAAKAAGCSRDTCYDHKNKDPEFARQWDSALAESIDNLEYYGYQQAIEGDSRLVEFFLKAHRPIYRERAEVAVAGGVIILPAKKAGDE
jgi:hypothetical protein